jgi:hypothetical protein
MTMHLAQRHNGALVRGYFVNDLALGRRDRNQLDPCHALQMQCCPAAPH